MKDRRGRRRSAARRSRSAASYRIAALLPIGLPPVACLQSQCRLPKAVQAGTTPEAGSRHQAPSHLEPPAGDRRRPATDRLRLGHQHHPVQETHLRTGQLSVLTVEDTIIGVEGFPPANDTTPCPYDSGRPFIIEQLWRSPKLVSVVSNGPSCPHSAKESSARVDNPKEWVEDAIVADAQSRLSSRWRRAGEEIHTRFSVNLEAVFTALAGRENWRSRT